MKTPAGPLPEIRIASPCPASWALMQGDDRTRFCAQCQKHVYNLSAMTPVAAAELIREKEGKLCVRLYRRADGTIIHGEDCPAGLVARQWSRVKSRLAGLASLIFLTLGLPRAQAGHPVMGEPLSMPTPTPAPSPAPTMGLIAIPAVPSPTPKHDK